MFPLSSFRKLCRALLQILDCTRCFQDSAHLYLKEWASFPHSDVYKCYLVWENQDYLGISWTFWFHSLFKGSCKCGAEQFGPTDLSNADGQSTDGQSHAVLREICKQRKQNIFWMVWLSHFFLTWKYLRILICICSCMSLSQLWWRVSWASSCVCDQTSTTTGLYETLPLDLWLRVVKPSAPRPITSSPALPRRLLRWTFCDFLKANLSVIHNH